MSTLGIYVHVPFCGKKCPYCDFYSVSYTRETAEEYVRAVLRNIRHYADPSRTVDTVYFGGGTPSLLSAEQVSRILGEMSVSFELCKNAEITLEANPCTLTPAKLSELREAGVNRLSVGVQSMIDDELKMLGRAHSARRAEQAVRDAAAAGFDNISCDLMIALPGQSAESLRFSAQQLAELPVQHISAYILKPEKGTSFEKSELRSRLPNEDAAAELYLQMVGLLEGRGFMQYEVSNFARAGFESRHNCRYWRCEDYLGIGPSAHSCYGGKRFAAERDLGGFISHEVQQVTVTDDSPCGFEELAMLRLRLKEGLRLGDVPEHRADIEKKIPPLIAEGYAEFDGETVSLTAKGFLMSNSVIEYLIF